MLHMTRSRRTHPNVLLANNPHDEVVVERNLEFVLRLRDEVVGEIADDSRVSPFQRVKRVNVASKPRPVLILVTRSASSEWAKELTGQDRA